MHCAPTPTLAELKTLLESAIHYHSDGISIHNSALLTDSIAEQLACNCLRADAAVALESQKAIWEICRHLGTPYTPCNPLMTSMTRDGISDMIVPIVDATSIPFELICIILAAGKEMEVGPLVFAVERSNPDFQGCVCKILCAAVRQSWQAPVLFYDGTATLPVETVNLDWKKMLYFNSYELPHDPLESLMGKMLRQKFEDLSPADWNRLAETPTESWSELRDEIYEVYCDLFEELDINETFPLVKRYVIPTWVKQDILETL